MSGKEEQRERPLSVKAAIVLVAVPIALYFLVKAFKIDPAYIVFGLLTVFFVIIPLVMALILFIVLISIFSAGLEGKAPTDRHKSKCRICGKEFEPPLGNRLLEAHMRSIHSDFVEAEKGVRHLLSIFLALLCLEVGFWFFPLAYPLKFTIIGIFLSVLKNIPGLGSLESHLLSADLLLFTITIIIGLRYYLIFRKHRGLYSQHPPESRGKAYEALRKLPGLSSQREETGREPGKSRIPLSELDELIRKAYASEAGEKPEDREQA
ncbi:MAG: hypothetical protein FGF53_11175 [Candidatus Brockarchaeota archaeon]|nr:hypothetical protein [Candidatus Brockarchaeota archaeon]